MTLSPSQLQLLRDSNRTFAIVGKFGREDRVALLSNFEGAEDADGRLTVEDFFKAIEPGLSVHYGDINRYGDDAFASYKLGTPLEGASGDAWQPLGSSSELLVASSVLAKITDDQKETADYKFEQIQKIGLDMYRDLLNHLSTVALYDYTEFREAIVTVAKAYVAERAPQLKDGKLALAAAEWTALLQSDSILAARVVNHLLSFPEDETRARDYLASTLRGEAAFQGKKEAAVDAVIASLCELKGYMERGEVPPADDGLGAWRTMASGQDFIDSGWLERFNGTHFHREGLPQNAGTFLTHCQEYLSAKYSVQRTLRAPALHPFFVCGLASKYAAHGSSGDLQRVGQQIFEQGVKHVRNRNFGESAAQASEAKQSVRSGFDEVRTGHKNLGENFESLIQDLEETVLLEVTLSRTFTSESLLKFARNVFKLLGQLAGGGKVAEILEEIERQRRALYKFRNVVLALLARSAAGEQPEIESVLKKEAKNDEEREFVAQILERFAGGGKEQEVEKLRDAFYHAWGKRTADAFAGAYEANAEEIDAQAERLDAAYSVKADSILQWSEERGGGSVATVELSTDTKADEDEGKRLRKRTKTKLQQRAKEIGRQMDEKARKRARPKVPIPLPADLLTAEHQSKLEKGEKITGHVEDDKGNVVAQGEASRGGLVLEMNKPLSPDLFAKIDSTLR